MRRASATVEARADKSSLRSKPDPRRRGPPRPRARPSRRRCPDAAKPARRSQHEARVEVPSIGFTWKSDPIETSHANFAIIAEEANGKYYSSSSPAPPGVAVAP